MQGKTSVKIYSAYQVRNCFCFSCSKRCRRTSVRERMNRQEDDTNMIQQLHCHLDISGLAGNHDQTLALATRARSTVRAYGHSTWLHNFDLACAHVPNLIDFAAAFANDAPYEIVRDVNLLGLKLLWRGIVMRRGRRCGSVWVGVSGDIGRAGVRGAAVRGRTGGVRGRLSAGICGRTVAGVSG